jgi:beta-phosphoglucomutase-like phosphatase (HAD superfamily)
VLCQLVLRELGIADAFQAVVSADFVESGKPDPYVYLHAARQLGVRPDECIAFEDSSSGVRAARAAGMSVVAIPSAGQTFAEGDSAPHARLDSLREFAHEHARALWAARG